MSEHMSVTGKCEFYHIPMDEDWGFAYCKRCKKIKQSLIVEFHQGIVSDYTQVICPTCKKTMWIAELTTREEDYPKTNKGRFHPKDDKKCKVCKKPTNHFDCAAVIWGKTDIYLCSGKCYKKYDKERNAK
jgi:hypothetical protein